MSLRQRERIIRHYDDTCCDACGSSSFHHNLTRTRLADTYWNLCTTCGMELRNEGTIGLKAYLRLRASYGEDVSDELLAGL